MPSLITHFKPYGITFHMNGQLTKLDSKQACNKCKNLKNLNSRIGNIHWLKLLWFLFAFTWITSCVDYTINLHLRKDFSLQKLPLVQLVDVFIFFVEIWVKISSAWPFGSRIVSSHTRQTWWWTWPTFWWTSLHLWGEDAVHKGHEGRQLGPLFPRHASLGQLYVGLH